MTKRILIDASNDQETRIASIQNEIIEDFEYEVVGKKQLRGNVYLARVSRVEPSLQAAFVEYGGNRQGFLAFSEIHPDYYRIPVEDRAKLLEKLIILDNIAFESCLINSAVTVLTKSFSPLNFLYNSFEIFIIFESTDPITILSAWLKSIQDLPSRRNSGLEQMYIFLLFNLSILINLVVPGKTVDFKKI